jgi:hypothetical protein
MIWLRRILVIPLALIFITSFVLLLFVTELNSTLGSPDFYNGQLRRAEVYTWIYSDLMPAALDEAEENQASELPIPIRVIKDDLVSVTEKTLPPEWLRTQAESAIEALVPYIVGDEDDFSITTELRDRIDPLAAAVIEVASRQEIYDYLVYEMISREIMDSIGQAVELPFGVTMSQGEVFSAITNALPDDWGHETLAEIVNNLAAYMKGDTNRIDVPIDITDSKAPALATIAATADQKLQDIFDDLPVCSSPEEFVMTDTLPDCRLPGMEYQDFKTALSIDVAATVDETIGDRIPDSWIYTDDQLRQSVGESNVELLDRARDLIVNGNTITEEDFREFISDDPDADLQGFDETRQWIHSVRTWLWALWLVPVLLLIAIGLLGGRNWRSKLAWALAVLFITCLVVFIALAVIQSNVIDEHAQTLIGDPSTEDGVALVTTEKGNEISYNSISTFVSNIQSSALYMMIASGIVLLGIIVWTVLEPRRHPRPDEQDPASIDSHPPG